MATKKKVVLVVDDEELDATAIRRILESQAGFTVVTAGTFEEGLAAFQKCDGEVDLAVLDVTLPGQNGVDLAKQLLAVKPDLHVLFVSGHVGASVIRFYGIDASDVHFLQKPFDAPTLLGRVDAAMANQERLQFVLTGRTS